MSSRDGTFCSVSDGLTFLHGSHTPCCTAVVDKHFEGYVTLQLMTRGAIDLSYDHVHHALAGRWCWTAFPGPHIRFRLADPAASWDHRYVAMHGPLVSRWFTEGLIARTPQPAPNDPRFESDFDELHGLMRSSERWARRRAINLLERLLLELAQARTDHQPMPPWLEAALSAVDRPDYDISAVAQRLGMGVSTLRRRFQLATGESIHAYALGRRLMLAAQRLRDSDLPVAIIAEEFGYEDVSYFTRQFRARIGMAPGAYRRSRA